MYQTYVAVTKNGMSITRIMADGPSCGKARLTYELQKNSSRISYFKKWESDGFMVKVNDSQDVVSIDDLIAQM